MGGLRDRRIVWDSSRGGQVKGCKACGKDPCKCRVPEVNVVPADVTADVRLDTSKKRSGKAVTVIGNLPHNPTYLAALLSRTLSQPVTNKPAMDTLSLYPRVTRPPM